MEDEKILSICIPSHNRADVILENLKDVLKIQDNRFDIVITDTSDRSGDYEKLLAIRDTRVKVIRNDVKSTAMENWFCALENADGIFVFHLNDRDKLIACNLLGFMAFLDRNKDCTGGVCKFLSEKEEPVIYQGVESTVMNMPYFALHTTGMVFQMKSWRKIPDRKNIFTREKSGCHPHDMILGRLSVMGDMFLYTKHIWEMAPVEFYKKNLSGAGMMRFFEPKERLFELKCCLRELESLDVVGEELKVAKRLQMIKNYINLSTLGYFYHTESEHEAIHYGNTPQKYSILQKKKIIDKVLKLYRRELALQGKTYASLKNWTYRNFIVGELAKKSHVIKSKQIRKLLRTMNRKRKLREDAMLR